VNISRGEERTRDGRMNPCLKGGRTLRKKGKRLQEEREVIYGDQSARGGRGKKKEA